MPIACPPCAWPTTLDAVGPEEDPSILLMGSAEIGGSSACIIAIRISRMPSRPGEDRQGAPAETRAMTKLDHAINAFLKSADRLAAGVSDRLGMRMPTTIQLKSGPYLLWTLPLAPAPAAPEIEAPMTTLKAESELRGAVLDRLIAARLRESKPVWEATLEQWRAITAQKSKPASAAPKAG